jgi:hypothetical protein
MTFKDAEDLIGDPSFRQALAKFFHVTVVEVTKWEKENLIPEAFSKRMFSSTDAIKDIAKKVTHEKKIMSFWLKERTLTMQK